MNIYLYVILYVVCSSSQLLYAQTLTEEQDAPSILSAKLAILAVGPKPPRRFGHAAKNIPNSAATLLPPRSGETPPKMLYTNTKTNRLFHHDNVSENSHAVKVSYNNSPSFSKVPASQTLKLHHKVAQNNQLYFSLNPLEPNSVNLILLKPSSLSPNRWKSEPSQHHLVLTSPQLVGKKLILVNLCRRSIKSKFHETEKLLEPGKFHAYSEISGLKHHRITAKYGRRNKVIIHTALQLKQSNHVLLYIFYDANPNTNDGRTVGLIRTRVNVAELLKKIHINSADR